MGMGEIEYMPENHAQVTREIWTSLALRSVFTQSAPQKGPFGENTPRYDPR